MNVNVLDHSQYPAIADPEVLAMLQAFYSRSAKPLTERLEQMEKQNLFAIKEALNKYVVGYGHSSIADCADIVITVEGISILAAKVIQDSPLYNGQETSTRYINFEDQPIYCPSDNLSDKSIQEDWVNFYSSLKTLVSIELGKKFPNEGLPEDQYARAINARTFDIVRAFLPAGATTQLSWKVSLRKAKERLSEMLLHPLEEIQSFAKETLEQLHALYPHTFPCPNPQDCLNDSRWSYLSSLGYSDRVNYFYSTDSRTVEYGQVVGTYSQIHDLYHPISDESKDALYFLNNRKRGVEVPYHFAQFGHFCFDFLLDFGSFRDVQRHRNGVCRLPMLTGKIGFHPWYLQQLPTSIQAEAIQFIREQYDRIDKLFLGADVQYYLPLGDMVQARTVYSLAEAIYVTELRTSRTVHPTLREIAHREAVIVQQHFPTIALYLDYTPDTLCVSRGNHDIIKREEA